MVPALVSSPAIMSVQSPTVSVLRAIILVLLTLRREDLLLFVTAERDEYDYPKRRAAISWC